MKKNKLILILCGVAVLVVAGVVSSHYFEWPVDSENAGGDISKASRFSREMESEKLTNMEELLQNDSAYKDGIVAAQVVMQTRAVQFGSLVDMSNEVAGKLPEFADLLKDMNDAQVTVANVNASLAEAGDDLNAVLGGEKRPDLAQNTINASLAYTNLQKLNALANRFIETTDKYLETAKGDDRLKFVRDQWVDYQQMTAALEGDKKTAEALAKKGNLLPAEKSLAAMGTFDVVNQIVVLTSSALSNNLSVNSSLSGAISQRVLNQVTQAVSDASVVAIRSANAQNLDFRSQEMVRVLSNTMGDLLGNAGDAEAFSMEVRHLGNMAKEIVASQANAGLQNQSQSAAGEHIKAAIASQAKTLGSQSNSLSSVNTRPGILNCVVLHGSAANVLDAYNSALEGVAGAALRQSQNIGLSHVIGNVISQTAAASNSVKLNKGPKIDP